MLPLAVKTGKLPLQRGQSREGHQLLVIERLDPVKLAGNEIELRSLRLYLSFEPDDFLPELTDVTTQQLLLALTRLCAGFEQRILRHDELLDILISGPRRQLGW